MCPTCGHTMQCLGSDAQIFWCPRCGTIREVYGESVHDEAPKLVERAVIYRNACVLAHGKGWPDRERWCGSGMDEAMSKPNERVA